MKRRYLYLALATLAMLVAGLMYNLTVFSEPVCRDIGCDQSTISLVFSLSQICFCLGGLLLGRLFDRVDCNRALAVASTGMGIGLLLSSRATEVWQLFACYSLLMNCSAGFVYKAVLSMVLPWFGERPGFASGVMMMGAGLTAFAFNVPTAYLIDAAGWRAAMAVVALVAFAVTAAASLGIRRRPADAPGTAEEPTEAGLRTSDSNDTKTADMVRSPSFYLYFAWTVLLLAGCTSVTGNATGLSRTIGLGTAAGAAMSMVLSVSNACSRIAYGALYDRCGRRLAMGCAALFFAVGTVMLQLAIVSRSAVLLSVAFVAVGLAFGGIPTISSTYILHTFGRANYASNFSAMGLYSLFSPVFGTTVFSVLYGSTQDYSISYSYLVAYAAIAAVLYLALNRLLAARGVARKAGEGTVTP